VPRSLVDHALALIFRSNIAELAQRLRGPTLTVMRAVILRGDFGLLDTAQPSHVVDRPRGPKRPPPGGNPGFLSRIHLKFEGCSARLPTRCTPLVGNTHSKIGDVGVGAREGDVPLGAIFRGDERYNNGSVFSGPRGGSLCT
jgi:hypothetical protein